MWWWGWRQDAGAKTPPSWVDMEWRQSKPEPPPSISTAEWSSAIKAREQHLSFQLQIFMVAIACGLLVSVLAARTDGILAVAIALGYFVVVWLPVSAAIAYGCNKATVAQMVNRPDLYASSHGYAMRSQPRLYAPDGLAPWGCSFVVLFLLGEIAVALLASRVAQLPIPATILFMAVVGFGIYGLADALIYARHGRPDLQERTGIDPVTMMKESGCRWHWYRGWVSEKSDGGSHRELT